jgi:hypothetical protein
MSTKLRLKLWITEEDENGNVVDFVACHEEVQPIADGKDRQDYEQRVKPYLQEKAFPYFDDLRNYRFHR